MASLAELSHTPPSSWDFIENSYEYDRKPPSGHMNFSTSTVSHDQYSYSNMGGAKLTESNLVDLCDLAMNNNDFYSGPLIEGERVFTPVFDCVAGEAIEISSIIRCKNRAFWGTINGRCCCGHCIESVDYHPLAHAD